MPRPCAPRHRHAANSSAPRARDGCPRPRACAGLDKATMSEEAPEPEVAAEGSSEPQVSALEKEMNALLATTQGVPRAPHPPTRSPRLRTGAKLSLARRRRRRRGVHSPAEALYPRRRAAPRQACWGGRCRPRPRRARSAASPRISRRASTSWPHRTRGTCSVPCIFVCVLVPPRLSPPNCAPAPPVCSGPAYSVPACCACACRVHVVSCDGRNGRVGHAHARCVQGPA